MDNETTKVEKHIWKFCSQECREQYREDCINDHTLSVEMKKGRNDVNSCVYCFGLLKG